MTDFNEQMMHHALKLARRGVGKTAPNPAVGCVIVKDGAVVGTGWHRRAGTPHAEVHALRQAGDRARGADAYVTLEPCSHFGRTPPCADALVEAGLARVVIGMVDPNPLVSGRGIARLRAAGVEVITGVLEEECRVLNEPFLKHVQTGMPFVICKSAMTMDGKIATASGDSKWITNERSRRYVHRLRSAADAVMVGIGTVEADDPQLTARIPGGKDPLRIVVDSSLRLSPEARLLRQQSSARTIVATVARDAARIGALDAAGCEVVTCRSVGGRVDLAELLALLGKRGVQSILLEGGGELAGYALRHGLIDKFVLFYAPKLLGGTGGYGPFAGESAVRMDACFRLGRVSVRRFADDVMIEAYPEGICLPD
ncbi:riboflavin biosynthesis protein RibD [Geotalea uraniireducens]|uniref:Riboflavin biosynthesis protein RibD n=1 Tax=Geotalea uraniireducens TaxID=351604 RepID=A0ABM8EL62_9BACT|nr:bifunctional diaminohydroxyphosphoribosylaminopyrimidine deaminase/5-amino-6-(5-phosphoribosylamino)uracil reductase RibD [Geotalea uraniireducens]BDV43298.1 riboflavin biosynthesis protein RibD [Geotalea uraniireducens]